MQPFTAGEQALQQFSLTSIISPFTLLFQDHLWNMCLYKCLRESLNSFPGYKDWENFGLAGRWLFTNIETHISHGIQSPRLPVRTGLIQMKSVVFMAAQSAIKRPWGTNSLKWLCVQQRTHTWINRAYHGNGWALPCQQPCLSPPTPIFLPLLNIFFHWGCPFSPCAFRCKPCNISGMLSIWLEHFLNHVAWQPQVWKTHGRLETFTLPWNC